MPEEKFQEWYSQIKKCALEYDDFVTRMAVIAGFFDGIPKDSVFTAAQVAQMLEIRNIESKKG